MGQGDMQWGVQSGPAGTSPTGCSLITGEALGAPKPSVKPATRRKGLPALALQREAVQRRQSPIRRLYSLTVLGGQEIRTFYVCLTAFRPGDHQDRPRSEGW